MTKRTTRAKPQTLVALCLDSSGSMGHLRQTTVDNINLILNGLRNNDTDDAPIHVARLSFGSFGKDVSLDAPLTRAKDLGSLLLKDYVPYGGTPLFDCVGLAIDHLQEFEALQRKRHKATKLLNFLVTVVTDGEENASVRFRAADFVRKLKELDTFNQWTFAFQVPKGKADWFSRQFQVPRGNVSEWELNDEGMRNMRIETVSATTNYMNNVRSAAATGQTVSMNSFYADVTTDLSKVKQTQVKRKLDDVSGKFKQFDVPAEAVVKDFVEAKTKRPYVIGSAFYLLMKPEKVQPQKQVLIQEKGSKAVWGGQEARDLIGLPTGTHAKVKPGNHSNYDIYVQSASVNRKLPRGTKLLVDTTMQHGVAPTWDHTAVAQAVKP